MVGAPAQVKPPGPPHRVMPSLSSKESVMSVYRVTEIIGTSGTSWEEAAAEAIRTAAGTIRDLRVAEVIKQDIHLDEDGAITYRTKLQLSFKYEHEH
jgi:dodecin